MKILITGGCGFLGSNVAVAMMQEGHDVCLFDNLSRQGSAINLQWLQSQGSFTFIHGDIRNANDVSRLIQTTAFDSVFHLAGQVAMTTSIANPRLDFETNALGTFNVLDALRLYNPNASMIYSSTNKVYGDLEEFTYNEEKNRYVCKEYPDGFTEDLKLNFHSPYGTSKGSADQYVLDFARIFGLKTVVFRHSSMYGGRQFSSYDQGWLGWFCQKALEQKKGSKEAFTISGNGLQVRDLLHAEDMKKLYKAVLGNIDNIAGTAYNIGGGINNSLSLLELFACLEQKLNIKLNYTKLPPRESDQKVFVANLNKITKNTSWQPQIGYKEGIDSMLKWLEVINK